MESILSDARRMDIRAFHAWLTALGEAWQRGDADATATLFAPGATYFRGAHPRSGPVRRPVDRA